MTAHVGTTAFSFRKAVLDCNIQYILHKGPERRGESLQLKRCHYIYLGLSNREV